MPYRNHIIVVVIIFVHLILRHTELSVECRPYGSYASYEGEPVGESLYILQCRPDLAGTGEAAEEVLGVSRSTKLPKTW